MSWDHKQTSNRALTEKISLLSLKIQQTLIQYPGITREQSLKALHRKYTCPFFDLLHCFPFCSQFFYSVHDNLGFTHVRNGWQHDGRADESMRKVVKPRDVLSTVLSVDGMHITYGIHYKRLNGFSET